MTAVSAPEIQAWGLLTLSRDDGPPFVGLRIWEKTATGWADKDGRTPEAMGFTVLAWMPLPRPFDTAKSNTLSLEWKTP
jgi:hypothetical protein